MKFCPKCGNELNDNQLNFCPKCGAPLPKNDVGNVVSEEQPEPVKQPQRTTKNKGVKIVLIALILVLACGAGYFAFNKYQEDQQEKERIAQEQAVAEQKEKEEQEKKEQEEKKIKEEKEKEELALKANSNKTILYALDNHRYSQYMNLIGEPSALVMANYNDDLNNGTIDIKSYDIAGALDDKVNAINWIQLKLSEPVYAETVMDAMSRFPLAILDKEKGYFLESDVNLGNGHTVKIYYYIDQETLNITNIEITEIDFKK